MDDSAKQQDHRVAKSSAAKQWRKQFDAMSIEELQQGLATHRFAQEGSPEDQDARLILEVKRERQAHDGEVAALKKRIESLEGELGHRRKTLFWSRAGVVVALFVAVSIWIGPGGHWARLFQRPYIDVAVNTEKGPAIENVRVMQQPLTIEVDSSRNAHDLVFIVTNNGSATVVRPVMLLGAEPNRVRFEPSQFTQLPDIRPVSILGGGYMISTRVLIPPDVNTFVIVFNLSGENLILHPLRIPAELSRRATGPKQP